MRRRLPHEPKELLTELTSWIEWRYGESKKRLVLTSAPTSLPSVLERWMPGAVWRLAWFENGAAILFGLAPSTRPGRYFLVRHDAVKAHREGIFEKLPDGTWRQTDGDSLEPESKNVTRTMTVRRDNRGRRAQRRKVAGSRQRRNRPGRRKLGLR